MRTPPPTSTQKIFGRFFYFFRFRTSSWGPVDIPSKNLFEIPTRTDFSRPHFHPFFPSLFVHFSFEQKPSFGHSKNPWSGQNRSKFFCRVSQRYCSETRFRCIRTFPPNIYVKFSLEPSFLDLVFFSPTEPPSTPYGPYRVENFLSSFAEILIPIDRTGVSGPSLKFFSLKST